LLAMLLGRNAVSLLLGRNAARAVFRLVATVCLLQATLAAPISKFDHKVKDQALVGHRPCAMPALIAFASNKLKSASHSKNPLETTEHTQGMSCVQSTIPWRRKGFYAPSP